MNLQNYSQAVQLIEQNELEKCKLLVFYYSSFHEESEVAISKIKDDFQTLHFTQPNYTRLKNNIKKSRDFIAASNVNFIKLHAKTIQDLNDKFPSLNRISEEIIFTSELISKELYRTTPTYIRRVFDQVNASFENNIFDGCAVLMRRSIEILLIQSYIKLGICSQIRDNQGSFKLLNNIINDAKNNSQLALSRNTKDTLQTYRELGNFAAHRIEYSTRKNDINNVSTNYRATIEELLYKSGHLS